MSGYGKVVTEKNKKGRIYVSKKRDFICILKRRLVDSWVRDVRSSSGTIHNMEN